MDTAATIRALEDAGIETGHACAIVDAIGRAGRDVATKADLERLEATLDAKFTAVEARITTRLYTCAVSIVGLLFAAQLFA